MQKINLESVLAGKKVVCIGTSPGQRKQLFLKDISECGVELTVLKFHGESFCIEPSFKVIEVPWENTKDVLGEIYDERFDCAITYDELHVERLSEIGNALNLRRKPSLSKESALRCRDKREMKKSFYENGIPTAEFLLWSEKRELIDCLNRLNLKNFDYVLKPAKGAASAGVLHVHSNENVDDAIKNFVNLCTDGAKKSGYESIVTPPYIVEKYIDRFGFPVELAVEGYVVNHRATPVLISEKVNMVKTGPFLENRYLSLPKSDFILNDILKIKQIAVRTAELLGINDSVFHLEMRYDNNDVKVIEIGSRPGGGLISESCERIKGINLRLQHLLLALGENPIEISESNIATCFGTIYYKKGFNPKNMGDVLQYLNSVNSFYEYHDDPEKRKHILHDWLVAYGIQASDSKSAWNKYYQMSDKIELLFSG